MALARSTSVWNGSTGLSSSAGLYGGYSGLASTFGAGASGPDFTLSNGTVTTSWATVTVGDLVPNGSTPAGAYFLIVEDTNPSAQYSGIYVGNG